MRRARVLLTINVLIWSLMSAWAGDSAEKKRYNRNTIADLRIPIAVRVDEDDVNILIKKLPKTLLELDKEDTLKSLVQRLKSEEVKPKEGETFESIAETLYDKNVVPVIAPRVEKFNDLLNREVTQGNVSAGLLAFAGIAEGISEFSKRSTEICLHGVYSHDREKFDQGRWRISDFSYNGMTNASRSVSAEIEEEITFDLKPYGKDHSFSWTFQSSGEVKVGFNYDADFESDRNIDGGPEVGVRLRTKAILTIEKSISEGNHFNLKGERRFSKKAEFRHPAILEVTLEADEKWWDRTSNKTIYDVILTKRGDSYLGLVDDLSAVAMVDEDKAEDMLRNLPTTIKTGITYAQAENIKRILEAAGATVKIK